MSLDVTAYSKVKHVEKLMDIDEFENKYRFDHDAGRYKIGDEKFTFVYDSLINGDSFHPEHAVGMKGGAYSYEDEFGHRAGSYSGYNNWRQRLCLMALGVVPREVWNYPEAHKDEPFYLLIDFSDCEGYIGTESCKVLAADFAKWQPRADAILDLDEDWCGWFVQKYADWRKTFELAAQDGFVDFH